MGRNKFLLSMLIALVILIYPSLAAIPSIYNIANYSINSTVTQITWATDEATNTTLFYGISSGSYSNNLSNRSFITAHNLSLTGLDVNTTYFYYINATNNLSESNTSIEFNFTTVYEDLIPPNVSIITPGNNTFLGINITINASVTESVNCSYSIMLGNSTASMSNAGIYYYGSATLSDGIYNITVNCTDSANHSSLATSYNVTIDSISPDIEINFPYENYVAPLHKIEFNFTMNESNIDKVWYTKNINTTKNIISPVNGTGINIYNITFEYPGKETLFLNANDSAGNLYTTEVTFYINSSINITAWEQDLLYYLPDANTVEVFNSSFKKATGNISTGELSIEINFTTISLVIYNLTSENLAWSAFMSAYDDSSVFETFVYENFGSSPRDYVTFADFSDFNNDTDDYYVRVKFPYNLSSYSNLYYCSEDDLSDCVVISSCEASSYYETNTTACYNTTNSNLYAFVPHFSSVFTTNDSQAPIMTTTSPSNNSVLTSSHQNDLDFTTNENSTCGYSLNTTGIYASIGGIPRESFSTNFSSYSNRYHNLTLNCTDISGNSGTSVIYFTINDTTKPSISLTVTSTVSGIKFDFTTNEPSNHTIFVSGETSKTNASFGITHLENFSSLEEDTTYYYNVTVCDSLGNCRNTSSTKRTSSSSSESSTGSTSGSTGSNSSSEIVKISQLWQSPQAGDYTLNIPTSSIAFTQIDITLNNDVSGDILFTLEKISELSASIPALSHAYQYVKIDKTLISEENLSGILFKFRVEKTWLTSNNIDPGTIALHRYTSQWDKLNTRQKSSDSIYYYYEADSPGMSYFAINGDIVVEQLEESPEQTSSPQEELPNTNIEIIQDTTEPEVSEPASVNKIIKSSNIFPVLIGVLVLAVIITGSFIFPMTQPKTAQGVITNLKQDTTTKQDVSQRQASKREELAKYIERCKAGGVAFIDIKNNLLNAGWQDSIIDEAMGKADIPETNTDGIKNYIVEMRKYEKTDAEIKANLLSAGWQEDIINEFFYK